MIREYEKKKKINKTRNKENTKIPTAARSSAVRGQRLLSQYNKCNNNIGAIFIVYEGPTRPDLYNESLKGSTGGEAAGPYINSL